MLAQLNRTAVKRAAAVGIAASLLLVTTGAPLATAEETAPPAAVEASAAPQQPTETSPSPSPEAASPSPAATQTPATQTPAPESGDPTPTASEPSQGDATPKVQQRAAAQAALDACEGVWVAVQASDSQPAALDCVHPATDATALALLGKAHTFGESFPGFVNQIDGFPEDTSWNEADPRFWNFCTATASGTGDLTWALSGQGAGDVTPAPSIPVIGFRWALWSGEAGDPVSQCPAVAWAPTTPTGPTPTPTPTSEPAVGSALDAANWLAKNPADADDPEGLWQSVIGLATVNQCSVAPAVNRALAALEKLADSYTLDKPGRAARLAIVAAAVGQDPTDFGGVDLLSRITPGLPFTGDPFSGSLAAIALTRAGQELPDALLESLLASQGADGVFGFGSGSAFFPDPDTTAMAIVALSGSTRADAKAAVDRAVQWAQANQLPDGSWENWVPANTTGLLGSALELVGADAGQAQAWLKGQQLASGALPGERDGTSADRYATAEGLFGLTGATYLTVSFDVADCDDTTGSDDEEDGETAPGELPRTGATDASGALGILAVVLVAAGGALVSVRRRQV